jgi:hypothetical protein
VPISPVSPAFDLDNIQRIADSLPVGLSDSGTGFNFNLNGSNSASFVAQTSVDSNLRNNVAATSPHTYILSGEVDWAGLIAPVPSGAVISNIRIQARIIYDLYSALNWIISASSTQFGRVWNEIFAELRAPITSFVPSTDDHIDEDDLQQFTTETANGSIRLSGNSILRKIWDLSGEPGGGIDKTTLESDFTDVEIYLLETFASSLFQFGSISNTVTGSHRTDFKLQTSQWLMVVTWEWQFQYTIDPPDNSEFLTPPIVTIESDPSDPDPLDLSTINIFVNGTPVTPISQGPNIFTFQIPTGITDSTIIITATGTQFSGEVGLAAYMVIEAEASGIYQLTPGKRNDTLYSPERDGSTYNVKIPNPFAKTGFVTDSGNDDGQ